MKQKKNIARISSAVFFVLAFVMLPDVAVAQCSAPKFKASRIFDLFFASCPFDIAAADFNSDGKTDLATANASNVSILLGDGAGNFGASAQFAIDGRSVEIVVSDFNGDGKQDLVSANSFANNVSVLLGNGMGGFAAAANFAVAGRADAVEVGDFNGDGFRDIAAANSSVNNVSILLGNGMGGFSAATDFIVGTSPRSLAVADFNGDAKSDIAAGNFNGGSVSILLGNGAGGFATAANFTVGGSPTSIAAADFNADAKLDLAVANGNVSSQYVSVLLGNGTGGFGAATNFATIPRSNYVGAADFNADGKLDLAVTSEADSLIASGASILLGNGAGGFAAATRFGVGPVPSSGVIADFNADGKPDLATSNAPGLSGGFCAQSVSVLLNNGAGGLITQSDFPLPVGARSTSIVAADFTGDGKRDLVTASSIRDVGGRIFLLAGDGAGGFGAAVAFPVIDSPGETVAADFNSDGRPDLAVAHPFSTTFEILLNNGAGGFGAAMNIVLPGFSKDLASGDFNSDGKTDLAVGRGDGISLLLGNGAGGFSLTNLSNGFSLVETADFNNDGKLDLITTDSSNATLTFNVLLGDGTGGFGTSIGTFITNFASASNLAVGDFNADNKPDAVILAANNSNAFVLLGNGAGGFAAPTMVFVGREAYSVTVGDFNGDNKLDFATAQGRGTDAVDVLTGDGAGGFTNRQFGAGSFPEDIVAADFNADGRLDLATANNTANNVSVLLNECLAPTAASVSVGGRVTVGKNGLARARVTLTDGSGETRSVLTNPFGYYRFDNAAAGGTYVFTISHKRYSFAPQVVSVTEDLTELNFTAEP